MEDITHLCSTFLNRLLLSTIPKPTIKFHKEKSHVQNDPIKQDISRQTRLILPTDPIKQDWSCQMIPSNKTHLVKQDWSRHNRLITSNGTDPEGSWYSQRSRCFWKRNAQKIQKNYCILVINNKVRTTWIFVFKFIFRFCHIDYHHTSNVTIHIIYIMSHIQTHISKMLNLKNLNSKGYN